YWPLRVLMTLSPPGGFPSVQRHRTSRAGGRYGTPWRARPCRIRTRNVKAFAFWPRLRRKSPPAYTRTHDVIRLADVFHAARDLRRVPPVIRHGSRGATS